MINENFLKLSESYLFTEIARKVNAYKEEHPKADVISLGIGDVTQPLAPAVIEALHKATDEMAIATMISVQEALTSRQTRCSSATVRRVTQETSRNCSPENVW